jgi:hypothetical protein
MNPENASEHQTARSRGPGVITADDTRKRMRYLMDLEQKSPENITDSLPIHTLWVFLQQNGSVKGEKLVWGQAIHKNRQAVSCQVAIKQRILKMCKPVHAHGTECGEMLLFWHRMVLLERCSAGSKLVDF